MDSVGGTWLYDGICLKRLQGHNNFLEWLHEACFAEPFQLEAFFDLVLYHSTLLLLLMHFLEVHMSRSRNLGNLWLSDLELFEHLLSHRILRSEI
jgi:hypothetical protein